MNKELSDKLCEDFPFIFKYKNGNTYPIGSGITAGDGWYNIIREICVEIESVQKLSGIEIVATQVKEKFGTLCFYTHEEPRLLKLTNDEHAKFIGSIIDFISKKRHESTQICDRCGEKATHRDGSYLRGTLVETRCSKCYEEK